MKALLVVFFALSACSYREEKEKTLIPKNLGFTEIKSLVLAPRCISCHGSQLSVYENIKPLLSEISMRVRADAGARIMPPSGSTSLSEEEREALLSWIKNGAPEGTPEEPVPQPVKPTPPRVLYQEVQQKVFEPRCIYCHNGFATYEGVLEKIRPIEQMVKQGMMPPDSEGPLSREEKNLVLDWIASGTPKSEDTQ